MQLTITSFLLMLNLYSASRAQDSLIANHDKELFYFLDESSLNEKGSIDIHGLYFNLGRYTLVNPDDPRILAIASFMLKHPTYIFEVGNHTDCRGSDLACVSLSQKRAEHVVDQLIKLGIPAYRLIPKGFGESKPAFLDGKELTCSYISQFSLPEREAFHQKNRRLTLQIISK